MKKQNFRRQFDPAYTGTKSSKEFGKSKTVPDHALTTRQILNRMAQGVDMSDLQRTGTYTEDDEIPVFDDISDFDRWKEAKALEIKEDKKLLDRSKRVLQRAETLHNEKKEGSKKPDKETSQE